MRRTRIPVCTFAYRFVTLTLVAAGLTALAGCGDGKIARYPVKGNVTVDGKPAEGAIVIFCPVGNGDPEFARQRPFSRTDAQGNYELRTLEPGDGAPAGQYKVMIRWTTPGAAQVQDRGVDPRGGGGLTDRLRGKYANPDQSGLTYTVVAGSNEVPPFELKTK